MSAKKKTSAAAHGPKPLSPEQEATIIGFLNGLFKGTGPNDGAEEVLRAIQEGRPDDRAPGEIATILSAIRLHDFLPGHLDGGKEAADPLAMIERLLSNPRAKATTTALMSGMAAVAAPGLGSVGGARGTRGGGGVGAALDPSDESLKHFLERLTSRSIDVDGDDEEWAEEDSVDGGVDDQLGQNVEVSDADLHQINAIIGKFVGLSLPVLEEIAREWRVPFTEPDDQMMNRTNVAERIRYTAANLIVGVANHYQCLHNTPIHNSAADIANLVNNLVLQLWQGISILNDGARKNVAVILDLEPLASADEICITVTGLAMTTLFRPLPLPLLETICRELRITPKQKEKIDPDILHEVLTHQICTYVYPSLSARTDMNLRCATHITVAENGPGSFTCTIVNAWMLGLVNRDVYTSNQFTCSKVKWRAQVAVDDGHLSFMVTQHVRSFMVKLTVRSNDGKKKKKAAAAAAAAADGTAVTAASASLFLEIEVPCAPRDRVALRDIVSIRELYSARSDLPGKRLYNAAEDKAVFQFSLETSPLEPPGGAAGAGAVAAAATTNTAPLAATPPPPAATAVQATLAANTPSAGGGAKGGKAAQKGAGSAAPAAAAPIPAPSAAAAATTTPSTAAAAAGGAGAPPASVASELLAMEAEERREKLNAKARQKLDKRRQALELEEQKARERIAASFAGAVGQIQDDYTRSLQRAQQRTRDRERKELATRMQPSLELQSQLAELQHTVQQKRSAVSKLAQEERGVAKLNAKLLEKLEERRAELEQLQRDFAADAAEVDALQREIEETREKKRQQEEAAAARAAARQRLKLEEREAPPTAAIKDFQSFWTAGAAPKPTHHSHHSHSSHNSHHDAEAPSSLFASKSLFDMGDAFAPAAVAAPHTPPHASTPGGSSSGGGGPHHPASGGRTPTVTIGGGGGGGLSADPLFGSLTGGASVGGISGGGGLGLGGGASTPPMASSAPADYFAGLSGRMPSSPSPTMPQSRSADPFHGFSVIDPATVGPSMGFGPPTPTMPVSPFMAPPPPQRPPHFAQMGGGGGGPTVGRGGGVMLPRGGGGVMQPGISLPPGGNGGWNPNVAFVPPHFGPPQVRGRGGAGGGGGMGVPPPSMHSPTWY